MESQPPLRRSRSAGRAVPVLAVAIIIGSAGAGGAAGRAPGQTVDGHVATLLEVPLHLSQATIDAHQIGAPRTNGTVTFAFDVRNDTRQRPFHLADRHDASRPGTASGQDTYGIVFLDRPLGQVGARVVAVVDREVAGVEHGIVPDTARSAYVYATHGLNRSFRYRAG